MKRIIVGIVILQLLSCGCGSADDETSLQIDGAVGKLSAEIQKPEGEKLQMVMILHGLTGHKNEKHITAFADALEAEGIASIRFDFNGHGDSDGKFEDMTIPKEIEDARRVYEYVRGLPYVESVSISGHSQGGVVASMLAGELGEEAFKGVVLFSPAAHVKDLVLQGTFPGSEEFDPDNPPEKLRLRDSYSLGREYIVTTQTLPIYETAARYTGPVCIVYGTKDEAVPYSCIEQYEEIYANSELHLIEGANHGYSGREDEVADIAVKFLKELE